jgi:hypothetical protein
VFEHEFNLVLHAQEGAAEVDRHQAVPLFVGDLGGRPDRLLDARVVEGDIQAAEPLDRRVERRLDLVTARDVAGHGERPAAGLLDHAGRLPVALRGDVGDHDTRALAREGERGGAADAARRSGDERDLPFEAATHGVERETVTVTSPLLPASASMPESMRPSLTRPGE